MSAATPRGTRARVGHRLIDLAALLGALTAIVAVVLPLVGLKPLVVASDSMAPDLDAGSLVLTRSTPAADLEVGDVVTVPVTGVAGGGSVTHRVVALERRGGGAVLTLRGDANVSPDAHRVEVTVVPRAELSVPWVGHALAALASPGGAAVLTAYAALVALLLIPRRRGRMVVLPLVLTTGIVLAGPAQAGWRDAVPVTGSSVATVVAAQPAVACGTLGLGTLTVTWQPVPHATGYVVRYGIGGLLSTTVPAGTTSRTFSLVSGIVTVEAVYGSASWVSTPSNSLVYNALSALTGATCLA